LDGDLLSVYGPQSLKFLDRPWNRQRALKATTVQFNFVSFDDLVRAKKCLVTISAESDKFYVVKVCAKFHQKSTFLNLSEFY
jgi:hypothetical protein